MSAECSKCGLDIVYPEGTWPVGECPACDRVVEITEDMVERAARALAPYHGQAVVGSDGTWEEDHLGWTDVDREWCRQLAREAFAAALPREQRG